jgi:hypothetical protein
MRFKEMLALVSIFSLGFAPGGLDSAPPAVRLAGHYMEFCSCSNLCQTMLQDPGKRAICDSVAAFQIEVGQYGSIAIPACTVVLVSPAPGPGTKAPRMYVDVPLTANQADCLRAFFTDRLGPRIGSALPAPVKTTITITRANEFRLFVDGACDLKGRPVMNGFGRHATIENAPGALLSYTQVGHGTAGQARDEKAGVIFDGDGRSLIHGKFDFGAPHGRRRAP